MAHNGVLIVAPSGPLLYGLRALLSSMQSVEIVGVVAHTIAAEQAISESRPAAVLLDSALPGEGFLPLLKHLKAQWPQLPCLVLVDGAEQQREAVVAAADAVLLKGVPAARLSAAVERLLTQEGQVKRAARAGQEVGSQIARSQQVLDDT